MTASEFRKALLLIVLIAASVAGAGGYLFVYSPLTDAARLRQQLQKEVDELEFQWLRGVKDRPYLAEVRRQSLPPDDTVAQSQYMQLLERLLLEAGIRDYKFASVGLVQGRPPVIPDVAPKRPAYKQHRVVINMEQVNIWQLVDFLYAYYQLDLLHQISGLKIEKNEREPSRNGLKVTLTTDAIAVDGVPPRTSLFPVTPVVAAVAGGPALHLVQNNPEQARLLRWVRAEPVLSPRKRDYTYIVLRDLFYGILPPYSPPKPTPFAMGTLSDVTLRRDGKPYQVQVRLSGDGSEGATITATVSGSLIPEDGLEVDEENWTITIPAVDPNVPESATSTVTVVATSAEGVEIKKSFRVSVERPVTPPPPPKPDIAWLITLPILSTASDGTAQAIIKDHFNNTRYLVRISNASIRVSKEIPWTNRTMKEDASYRRTHPPGMLVISDDGASATSHTFRVIAIDEQGLILLDTKPAEPPRKEPGRFGRPAPQGRADPLAAVAGNPSTVLPKPVYYRWKPGTTLKQTLETGRLRPEEAADILRRIAVAGTVVLGRIPEQGQ